MKTVKIIAIGFLFATQAFAAPTHITATVKGMVCAFCAQGITKKFKAEPAVAKVDVSLEKKLVTLELKEGQSLDDKKIEGIIKDAGYNTEKIARD